MEKFTSLDKSRKSASVIKESRLHKTARASGDGYRLFPVEAMFCGEIFFLTKI